MSGSMKKALLCVEKVFVLAIKKPSSCMYFFISNIGWHRYVEGTQVCGNPVEEINGVVACYK